MNPTLRRAIQIFVLFGFPFFGFLYAFQFQGQKRDQIVPFQTFKAPLSNGVSTVGGDTKNLQLKEAVTAVCFWATWCPPCVEEFPAMVELQRQLEGKGFEVLFVSVDEKWADVNQFMQNYRIKIAPERLFLDHDKKMAMAWGSVKFPETYILRRDGWVVEKIVGAQQWTRPAVLTYFENLVAKFSKLQAISGMQPRKVPWPALFVNSAYAESAPEPLIHEDDKKALANLRKNIETASQNLERAEAALRKEERNLKEQEQVFKRREQERIEAEADLAKLQAKHRDVETSSTKQRLALKSEEAEKTRTENGIKAIESRIKNLQKQLEENKEELNTTNKSLQSRNQTLGTITQALESLQEEKDGLEKRLGEAGRIAKDRQTKSSEAQDEISARKQKLKEIDQEKTKNTEVLKEQKQKLTEFEKALQR